MNLGTALQTLTSAELGQAEGAQRKVSVGGVAAALELALCSHLLQ